MRQAREPADKITEDAGQRAAQISQAIVADASRQANETQRQRLAQARADARDKRLRAREKILLHGWVQAE